MCKFCIFAFELLIESSTVSFVSLNLMDKIKVDKLVSRIRIFVQYYLIDDRKQITAPNALAEQYMERSLHPI